MKTYMLDQACNSLSSLGGLESKVKVIGQGALCTPYAAGGRNPPSTAWSPFIDLSTCVSLEFSKLQEIKDYGMLGTFYTPKSTYMKTLTSVSFPKLKTVGMYGLAYAFAGANTGYSALTSISFPALETVGMYGFYNAFLYCGSVASVSFPSLTIVDDISVFDGMFYGASTNVAVHFPAAMQGQLDQGIVSADLGNATLYFDL